MRNSEEKLAPFLNHHTALGVDHFLVLDDWSEPAFLKTLSGFRNITVMRAPFRYQERIRWVDSKGQRKTGIAGPVLRQLISRYIVKSGWSVTLDDDEFLLLAPRFKTLRHLFAWADDHGYSVFAAQMVDFVPRIWPDAEHCASAKTFGEMVQHYPLFKPKRAWKRDGEEIHWNRDCNAISDLFRETGIYSGPAWLRWLKPVLRPVLPQIRSYPVSDVTKVPVVSARQRHVPQSAHGIETRVDGPMVIALAHFTLTRGFPAKVKNYLNLREGGRRHLSWSRYDAYGRLLRRLEGSEPFDFESLSLAEFSGVDSLLAAGILE